jgi:hypothetical protein
MFVISFVLIVLGVAVIAAALVVTMRRSGGVGVAVMRPRGSPPPRPAEVRTEESVAFDEDVIVEPYPAAVVAELVTAPPAVPQPIWPDRVQRNAAPLDAAARLRLIADLALLRAGWCIPILEEACAQETDPALHAAAAAALARCRPPSRPAPEMAFSTNGAPPEDRAPERSPLG